MTKKYLVGNWKMNKTVQEATDFIEYLLPKLARLDINISNLFIAPSFVHLLAIKPSIDVHPFIRLAAQNCHHKTEGAFTGEVSAAMLSTIGVECVIIGHSERRIYQQETHILLAKKIKKVLEAGMHPLLCCGEGLEDRNSGNYKLVIQQQLEESLSGLTSLEVKKLLIAYEPVWAIGTGESASLEVITETHAFIRRVLLNQYGILGSEIPILYGGSCNEQNAATIFSSINVDGGLIGSASLEADPMIKIITALFEQ